MTFKPLSQFVPTFDSITAGTNGSLEGCCSCPSSRNLKNAHQHQDQNETEGDTK